MGSPHASRENKSTQKLHNYDYARTFATSLIVISQCPTKKLRPRRPPN